jgi:hypothetical protein
MTAEEVSAVLYRVVSDKSQALQRGARDRARIEQTIGRGEVPYGHRVDWLQETAEALNQVLLTKAREFNERFPGDCISVDDFLDALATLAGGYRNFR